MHKLSVPLVLIALSITLVTCENYGPDSNRINSLIGDSESTDSRDGSLDKRQERYAFGLGRRAYTYTSGGSGVKRLPVYNFGLGKRARPYSFGLGKRASFDDDYSDGSYNSWSMALPDSDDGKRGDQPFGFGLGKRLSMQSEPMERRSAAQRYNFGLGRR